MVRPEPAALLDRPRLTALLDRPARVVLVVAPPGFGKSVAARQWAADSTTPTAWVGPGDDHGDAATFWLRFTRALRAVLPSVDDEAETALVENVRKDFFLAILISQIERSPDLATVVLDDLPSRTDRSILDGLALLTERVGDRLRLVVTARADPMLPIARWRTTGWLSDVRADALRLTDDEAAAIATNFDGLIIDESTAAALNHHVEGWPIAFHLALVSLRDSPDPARRADAFVRSDVRLADVLVGEILDQLPDRTRDAALVLSVVEWFDTEIAEALAGPGALATVDDLRRRRLLIPVEDRPGATQFHSLFRDLLRGVLAWRDPARHEALHRTAADVWIRRGQLGMAHRHLVAVGDLAAATDLVMEPTLRLVDRGDRAGLARLAMSLPSPSVVGDPVVALDLAMTSLFAGNVPTATTWCDRAEELGATTDPIAVSRLATTRAVLALMNGDLSSAADHVREVERLTSRAPTTWPVERRFVTVAARASLARGDVEDARRRLARPFGPEEQIPEVVRTVTVPGLEAWLELLTGHAVKATELAEAACDRAERLGARPHHGVSDALVTAAWCRLGTGDLSLAVELADAAQVDAEQLGVDWHRIRAGVVAAEVRLLTDGPDAALSVVGSVRGRLEHGSSSLAARLDLVEVKALQRLGRIEDAAVLAKGLDDGPEVRLRLAELALAGRRLADVHALLDGSDEWVRPLRFEAAAVRAAASLRAEGTRELIDAVEEASAAGWVWPFLGRGARVETVLRALPLERLHSRLARHLAPPDRQAQSIVTTLVEPLTSREQTIVTLLPSYLSYAQIGEQLHLSVNTVKSNLKAIYRKLGVTTRADAVDAARAHHLV